MKSIKSIIFISIFFILSSVVCAQQYTTGDKGVFAFEYRWDNESQKELPSFSIMHSVNEGKGMYGYVFGTITSSTEFVFLGKELKNMNKGLLHLLDGKEVTVICELKQIGEGEQSSLQCLKMYITLVK